MPVKKKPMVSPKTIAKARQVLAYAREKAQTCRYSNELFNAIFSATGKASELFSTESERDAFTNTREINEVYKLIQMLPRPPIQEMVGNGANGHLSINVRLPKSVHTALLAEAAAEGVSLDQLCLSKLVAQLRELV